LCQRTHLAEAIVQGLSTGADDYIVKPFDLIVLRARIHAVLRRAAPAAVRPAGNLEPMPLH
jgi:DNA-binding response OmpR family regulator